MSRDFPDWIDVRRAAQAGRRFAGEARLEWMPRVLDLLDAPAPADAIAFEIQAAIDEQRTVRLSVHVHGDVPMTCQRTLRRFMQPIDSESTVAIVASEREAEALPDDLEPKLVTDARLRLVELVEDELLLALPLVPRDPASEPVVGDGEIADDERTNEDGPFAELARLRRGRH